MTGRTDSEDDGKITGVAMSANQPSSGSDPNAEVELDGTLAEFREALRAEIEAARSASQSSAVQLVHGERIGRAADGHQYRFKLKNPQMALADDMPGDLYVPGKERADANVISLAGGTMTLSVSVDFGQYVPSASLSSNLTNLLRKLISRIEDFSESDRENPAGALLLGEKAPSGDPEPFEAQKLNDDQRAAVAAGLGRDVTFIQGPP